MQKMADGGGEKKWGVVLDKEGRNGVMPFTRRVCEAELSEPRIPMPGVIGF
jgi:hypothetical protein